MQQIRASTLSGECDWIEEFDRGVFGMRAQHQVSRCVLQHYNII
jgi:hypothetical protein